MTTEIRNELIAGSVTADQIQAIAGAQFDDLEGANRDSVRAKLSAKPYPKVKQ